MAYVVARLRRGCRCHREQRDRRAGPQANSASPCLHSRRLFEERSRGRVELPLARMPIYEFGSKTNGSYRAFGLQRPIVPDLPRIDCGQGQRLGQPDAAITRNYPAWAEN